jgi:hypothetical protein
MVAGGSNYRIDGNIIGTNATGTAALAHNTGVLIFNPGVNNTTLGGTTPGARNLISGNSQLGVSIDGGSTGNRIEGNYIGTNASGTEALANIGVWVSLSGSSITTVGGTVSGAGNVIANNGGNGIRVNGSGTTGNSILGNSIFSNTGIGIDLSPLGVTANDAGDADTGPNGLQNFPLLTSASVGAGTAVGGTLNSTPSASFRIELFASPACDASGNGEGQTFLGFTNATTDGAGNASFVASVPTVAVGQAITATATNLASNDTSEFSACRTVQQAGFTVSPVSGPTTEANEGGPSDASFTVRLNSVPAADVTLTLGVSDATEGAIVGPTTLTFTPANATTPQTVRLIGVDDTIADGNVVYAVVFAAATSNDAAYTGLKPSDLAVTNLDDDTPCSPRPRVRISTVVVGSGQLSATIAATTSSTAPSNSLVSIRLARIDNATVTLNGSPITVGPAVTLPGGASQARLLVQREAAGRASTVSIVAVDACGDWPTFVGGGPNAF